MTAPAAPPPSVLAAFGAGRPVPEPGGQGRTWRAGDVFLKPCDGEEEAAWVAAVLAALPASPLFRVPTPVAAADGASRRRWTVEGWQAWRAVAGHPDPSRAAEVLRAAAAFHDAVAGLPRPAFLDRRDDPWTYGEQVAWERSPVAPDGLMGDLLLALADAREPLDLPGQPVHGDLLGNVLFADGLPPAVIDWAVYFRPRLWADAVAVVDALTWTGAGTALLRHGTGRPGWRQALVRALMYRIATNEGMRRAGRAVRECPEHYRPVVDLVLGFGDAGS